MGWWYNWKDKGEMVKELTQTQQWDDENVHHVYSCVASEQVGNILWTVMEDASPGKAVREIICNLMSYENGMWGYKPIGESSGPFYYDCPTRLLDLAPVRDEEWRSKVYAYHRKARVR
jgi:hypothetical protein